MKIEIERLKRPLLYLSIIFFLIPIIDSFILPLSNQKVTIQSYPENHSVRWSEIYLFDLSNGKELNVKQQVSSLLSIGDTCSISYTFLNKANKLNFSKDGNTYKVKIGMLHVSTFITIWLALLMIPALLLLFTKKLDNYGASDIGPIIICFFNLMFFFSYLTHN